MKYKDFDLENVALYLGTNLLSENSRKQYVTDVRVSYMAAEIVYIFQYIALSINGFLVGLASAYFYEWLNKEKNEAKLKELLQQAYEANKNQLNRIEGKINQASEYIKGKNKIEKYEELLNDYKRLNTKLKDKNTFLMELSKHAISYSRLSKKDIEKFMSQYNL